MIRAFVAIPVPDAVRRVLEGIQAGLPVGRPVAPENFHLTLAFLGEQPEPVLEDVHYALTDVHGRGFDLALEGVGTFGTGQPRVLYAGLAPSEALDRLQGKVMRATREAGLRLAHRRFHPHVTLARFGQPLMADEQTRLQAFIGRRLSFGTPPFGVNTFVLYESILGRQGPVYRPLADYALTDTVVA